MITGIICLVLSIPSFIFKAWFFGAFLFIVGIFLIINGTKENEIEQRKDLNLKEVKIK